MFDFIYLWKFIIIWISFIHENSFTFYSFMKVLYSRISHHSCKIHALSHIFFEHLHDFKTHTYVQIKIKISKIAFLSKYCKFDIWSYFQLLFSKLRHMNSVFFRTWSHSFSIFELDHIIFFFYWKKKENLTWEKEISHEKKNFISSFCYSTLIHSRLEFIEYRMKRISSWISLIITNYLNIAEHDQSLEYSWMFEYRWLWI